MKNLFLVIAVVFSTTTLAKTKTVSLTYEYEIEYKKVTAEVVCVASMNTEGEYNYDETIWFAPSSYKKAKALKDAGYKPQLNGEKGEQCDSHFTPGIGGTPLVMVYTNWGVTNQAVKKAMKDQNIQFVKRELVFKKSTFDKEILMENLSTAEDDVMSDVWSE